LDASGLDAMAANLRGLTEEQAERAVSQAIVTRYGLTAEIVTDVLQAKKDILRRSEMMDFVEVSDTLASVGGLENLKHWLEERRGTWEERARAFGLEPPRGVVILGVQGCGKSMCAQAIAGEWKLPLVKFDTAAIFDKYIGETEKRIQKVFQVAEELSPCVLWIDELEKVFAGSGSGSASADAGVSSRLLGAFLSWMQERKAPVFVAATCNDVSAMPPELIRKGRFDELFFVDLPNQRERNRSSLLSCSAGIGFHRTSIWIKSRLRRRATLERRFKLRSKRGSTAHFPAIRRWEHPPCSMRWRRPCRFRLPDPKRFRSLGIGHERVQFQHRSPMRRARARKPCVFAWESHRH